MPVMIRFEHEHVREHHRIAGAVLLQACGLWEGRADGCGCGRGVGVRWGDKVTREVTILSLSIFIVLQYNFDFMDSFRIG